MKKFKRLFVIILAIILFVSGLSVESLALESRSSDYFLSHSISVTKTSDTTFKISFSVTGKHTMSEIGVKYIKIQRSSDGTSWETMRTLYESSYPDFIVTNTAKNSDSVTYTGNSGYYYRVYVRFYAADSSGSASKYMYSNQVRLT